MNARANDESEVLDDIEDDDKELPEGTPSEPDEPEDDEPEGDDEPESEDDDLVEFDTGFEKYRVPAKLKDYVENWRTSQARRDQEIAETRKALESRQKEIEEQAKHSAEVLQRRGELAHAERMLQAYAKYNWDELEQNDPGQAARAQREWSQWRDYRDGLKSQIADDEKRTQDTQRQATAKRIEEARNVLARDIPDWHEVGPKVAEFAIRELGYTVEDLMTLTDPKLGKALHRAWKNAGLAEKQQAAAKKVIKKVDSPPVVVPAKKVGGGRSRASNEPRDDDPMDVWMKKEAARVKALNG